MYYDNDIRAVCSNNTKQGIGHNLDWWKNEPSWVSIQVTESIKHKIREHVDMWVCLFVYELVSERETETEEALF